MLKQVLTSSLKIVLFLLFVGFANFCLAGENIWTTDGPEGASVKTIAIDPLDNNIIYIGTIQNGVYRSTDSGESWTHEVISANLPSTTMRKIVIHPFGPDTLYASTAAGIFKSTDSGISWIDISPPGRGNQEFRALVLDPIQPNIIITGGVWDRWKSTDSGQNWQTFSIDPPWPGGPDHEIDGLAINPASPNILYLITCDAQYGRGIYKSTDEGDTWFSIHNNSDSSGIGRDVEIDPINTNTIYYARYDAFRESGGRFLSKSIDGGATWFDISPHGLNIWGVYSICISPMDNNTIYIGTNEDGIFRSTDGGQNWYALNDSLTCLRVFSVEVAPLSGIVFLGLQLDGIYKSIDGGVFWRKISQNIIATNFFDLAFTPATAPGVFAVGQIGCYFQQAEGERWQYINTGIPNGNLPSSIEADKLDSSCLYISSYSYFYPPSSPNGLFFSTDNGLSWSFKNNGLPEDQAFIDVAISSFDDGTKRVFMGSNFNLPSADIYYSDDLGESWNKCEGGLPDQTYWLIDVAPSNPDVILAADDNNQLFLSADRGNSWNETTSLPNIEGDNVEDIEFDPSDFTIIYASCSMGGLFKSSDMGQSWANITNNIPLYPSFPCIYGPAINPYNTQNMFVFANHTGVYQTHDGGSHWESFNAGLDTSMSSGKIFFGSTDTTRLYVTSPARSVWSIHRTAEGAADDEPGFPHNFYLSPAYPNPFNAQTTISYALPKAGHVSLTVYNVMGQKVATLADGFQQAGEHRIIWDATDTPSGVYFYRLKAGEMSRTEKCILLK